MKANAPVTCLAVCLAFASAAASAAAPAAPMADWRDAPVTPGYWHWQREGALSVARFGNAAAGTRFSLTCDKTTRTVTLRRSAAGAQTGPALLTITTSDAQRMIEALPDGSSSQSLSARLGADDPLLDAMAFSRGRFMIESPGNPPLYLPSWAEVSRVIEDCR